MALSHQRGFSLLDLVFIIVLVGGIAAGIFYIRQQRQTAQPDQASSNQLLSEAQIADAKAANEQVEAAFRGFVTDGHTLSRLRDDGLITQKALDQEGQDLTCSNSPLAFADYRFYVSNVDDLTAKAAVWGMHNGSGRLQANLELFKEFGTWKIDGWSCP